jgi:stearoyl-CoA desaturase (delta-9 desaturase)
MFAGLIALPWWGYLLATLALTHVTIAAVTIFLHRHQAHRALELHPAASHFFRFWLWLSTGMVTREWVAVHRKHHAKCETAADPHSPQVAGIHRVLWGGVGLYRREAARGDTLEKYGKRTPDDWLERHLYTPHNGLGLVLMAIVDTLLFGVGPGIAIFAAQVLWIPFWAAGVINGLGHWWGYRNFACEDASTNLIPWGLLIGGEELHNNHHAFASSAKLSHRWYEFDIGWAYIRLMEWLGLARVRKVAPKLRRDPVKSHIDLATLQAVITHRYEVLAKFAHSARNAYAAEWSKLRRQGMAVESPASLRRLLKRNPAHLGRPEQERLAALLANSPVLSTLMAMKEELNSLWERSTASREQLLAQLEDWCRRAEASNIEALQRFSRQLRSFA